MNKNVRIYETLDSASKLERERTSGGLRLTGVFGKCGVRNSNNRIYEKSNYGKMVSLLQEEIAEKHGVMGELEHPNSMNINLNNVSHKIESIQMNEDGTVTGTILLLNTTKGKEAQAIIEGGLDLYISSRASGQIDKDGRVVLESLKTYDLVGTPGFSEAKMSICEGLKKGQKAHMINESLYYVTENEDEDIEDFEEIDEPAAEPAAEPAPCDANALQQILARLDAIEAKLESCPCATDISKEISFAAQGAVEESKRWVNKRFAAGVEKWIREEFEPSLINKTAKGVEKWIAESFTPRVEKWINEHYAKNAERRIGEKVQGWLTEEFAPVIEGWVNKEFAPVVEGWVNKEFASTVERWINEEYRADQTKKIAEGVQGWLDKEFVPEVDKWIKEELCPEVYGNVSAYIAEQKKTSLDTIDAMLDMVESSGAGNAAQGIITEDANEFVGNIALETMPKAYRPLWNMCSESKQADILNRAKLYDLLKEGAAEKFWSSIDFASEVPAVSVNENYGSAYENHVIAGIRRLKKF